ncbi:hypothetical protein BU17DRAFT_73160 [Hysterangium stoloniferum]|nr:hypothetical protein BU17DRAFT_73160 [Hysterangium stoloniferum]
MSTLSFPNPHDPSHHDSPTSAGGQSHHSGHISFYPSSYDPHASSSSFQINPLSSHPPRTPRTSVVTSAVHSYPQDLYVNTEESSDPRLVLSDGEDEEEEDDAQLEDRAGTRVRREEVWREVLATSTGRDKALKLIQYSMRVYLLCHSGLRNSRWAVSSGASRPTWEIAMLQRFDSTIAGLSLARKCLILFNWLTPFTSITAPQPLPFASASKLDDSVHNLRKKPPPKPPLLHTFLHAPPPLLLDLLNSLADDIATFSRLGLIGKRIGEKAGRLADWCWFSGTLVGLVEVGVEQGLVKNMMDEAEARMYASTLGDGAPVMSGNSLQIKAEEKELEKLKRQYYWLRISRMKLLMDLVFVSYECFKLQRGRRAIMPVSGLLSAILSSLKLYDRHRTTLMKAVS